MTTNTITLPAPTAAEIGSILGFTLFVVSEIIPLLPIPANGIFHSFVIGLQNSFKSPIKIDIEKGMDGNNNALNNSNENLNINSKSIQIQKCPNCSSDIDYIMNYLNENPSKIKEIKEFIRN